MTHSQKQWSEWPLILCLVWFFQALEISVLRLPFQNGALQITPVVIVYLAMTRNWEKLSLLTLVFSFLGTFTVGYSWIIYMAAQFWMAMTVKLFITGFTVDSRLSFAALVFCATGFGKLLSGFLLNSSGIQLSFFHTLKDSILYSAASGLLGFFCFTLFFVWDEYFNHPHIDASEMNPDIIK